MRLHDYAGHTIRVTFIDGKVMEGYAEDYESELDNPEGVETLSIRLNPNDRTMIEFTADEVTSIEIID